MRASSLRCCGLVHTCHTMQVHAQHHTFSLLPVFQTYLQQARHPCFVHQAPLPSERSCRAKLSNACSPGGTLEACVNLQEEETSLSMPDNGTEDLQQEVPADSRSDTTQGGDSSTVEWRAARAEHLLQKFADSDQPWQAPGLARLSIAIARVSLTRCLTGCRTCVSL